jgi:YegS/Rv2252/BmrU family lipid kinase
MKKTFLVVNPSSGNGDTGKRWAQLSASVGKALGEFGHAFTERPMDAARLTRKAIEQGYECIVAVGGDGTVNEVVNGFFRNGDGNLLNPDVSLGVICRGTGGDFRRTFDWDLKLDSALKRLQGAETKPLDVGMVEYLSHAGKKETRYFANICSFGASGLVDKVVNESSKVLGGKLSFMVGSLKALMKYSDQKVRISLDGGAAEEVDVTTLAVANCQFFGGGMKVAPSANPHDGVFDVTIWSGYGLSDFVLRSAGVYSGAHVKWKGTRTLRCRSFTAEPVGDAEVLLDVDGEQPGRLPCRISLVPAAIPLKI